MSSKDKRVLTDAELEKVAGGRPRRGLTSNSGSPSGSGSVRHISSTPVLLPSSKIRFPSGSSTVWKY